MTGSAAFRVPLILAAGVVFFGCETASLPMSVDFAGADEYRSRPLVRGVSYDPGAGRTFMAICPERDHVCRIVLVSRAATTAVPLSIRDASEDGYEWPSVSPDGRRLLAVRSPATIRADQPATMAQAVVEIDLETGIQTVLARHSGLLFKPTYIDNAHVAYFASDGLAPVRGCTSACLHVAQRVSLVVRDRQRELARIDGFDAGATGGGMETAGGDTILVDAWSSAAEPEDRRLRAVLVMATEPYVAEFPTPAAAVERIWLDVARPAAWIVHGDGRSARPTLAPFLDADAGTSFGTNVDLLEDGTAVHVRKVDRMARTGFRIVFRRLSQTGWVEERSQTVFLS